VQTELFNVAIQRQPAVLFLDGVGSPETGFVSFSLPWCCNSRDVLQVTSITFRLLMCCPPLSFPRIHKSSFLSISVIFSPSVSSADSFGRQFMLLTLSCCGGLQVGYHELAVGCILRFNQLKAAGSLAENVSLLATSAEYVGVSFATRLGRI
jgi:hypothetical protein